jgi:hypothetical protein
MKVLVCGGRNWTKANPIKRELEKLPEESTIIHGACKGADSLAGVIGRSLGYEIKSYSAKWSTFGKAAGAIRNQEMLNDNEDIELVLAFHENITESRGTKDMVTRATNAGINCLIFTK